jgi:hypothetical protein
MNIRYDEKGKFFTDIITKDTVPSIVQTLTTRIQGYLHVRINERVKDELNRGEQFLAITDAQIFDLDGKKLYDAEFLLLNRDHIVWVIPEDEIPTRSQTGDGEA